MSQPDHDGFERLLEYLRLARGFDFTAYKPTSLVRRIHKRMHADRRRGLRRLSRSPAGSSRRIHRAVQHDPDQRDVVLPRRGRVGGAACDRCCRTCSPRSGPIRVWSAGCASGEEAYTSAIVLAEALGLDAFRNRVKIYATDVDEEALAESRRAVYTAKQVADVPPALLARYFDRNGGDLYTFNRELRRSVIFGRHDLIQDAPISRVDLLFCRNTLMYFNSEAQTRILARFYFSVNPGGHLVLGRAEMLFSHAATFQPVDLKRRIFKTIPKVKQRDRLPLLAPPEREDSVPDHPTHTRLRDAAFELGPDAQIVLDPLGVLVAANAAARSQFGLADADMAQAAAGSRDLLPARRPAHAHRSLAPRAARSRPARPALGARRRHPLPRHLRRSAVRRGARAARHPHQLRRRHAAQEPAGRADPFEAGARDGLRRAAVHQRGTGDDQRGTAVDRRGAGDDERGAAVDQRRAGDDERGAAVDQRGAADHERRAAQPQHRAQLEQCVPRGGLHQPAFRGGRARPRVARAGVEHRRTRHVGPASGRGAGASFFNLDIGLPVGELHQPIREVLSGAAMHRELALPATNRRGKSVRCRVAIAPLLGVDKDVTGTILLIEDEAIA